MSKAHHGPSIAFIDELCNQLSQENRDAAQANFLAYLRIVQRIAEYADTHASPSDIPSPDSTNRDFDSTIQSPEGPGSSDHV